MHAATQANTNHTLTYQPVCPHNLLSKPSMSLLSMQQARTKFTHLPFRARCSLSRFGSFCTKIAYFYYYNASFNPLQVLLSSKELHMMIHDTAACAVSSGVGNSINDDTVGYTVDQKTFFALMRNSLWY